jgi:hypothetical protein
LKRLIVIATLALLPTFGFAQGQVDFFTFNATNAALGQVFQNNGFPADTNFVGQLYGNTVSNSASLTAQGTATTFFRSSGYITAPIVTVDNGVGGATYFYEIRAWSGAATYAAALNMPGAQWGKSAIIQIVLGGLVEGGPPAFPEAANLFPNFTLALNPVPEPSAIILGILGAAALLFRRGKSA